MSISAAPTQRSHPEAGNVHASTFAHHSVSDIERSIDGTGCASTTLPLTLTFTQPSPNPCLTLAPTLILTLHPLPPPHPSLPLTRYVRSELVNRADSFTTADDVAGVALPHDRRGLVSMRRGGMVKVRPRVFGPKIGPKIGPRDHVVPAQRR